MFEPVLMKLNQEERWFELCAEKPVELPRPPTAQEVAEFVGGRIEVRTDDIKEHFAQRASSRSMDGRIKEAERIGLIYKPSQKAPWRLRKGENDDFTASPQLPDFSKDDDLRNSATPIGTAPMRKQATNGRPPAEIAYCECGAAGIQFSSCGRCGEFLR